MEFNTTLLRERFILRDIEREGEVPIVAVSNRLSLPLKSKNSDLSDTVIIRAQNMHICIRMAAQILQSFLRVGPFLGSATSFDFMLAWESAISEYETECNLARWVVLYHKGKEIFSFGTHHPFLDVIERCDAKNPGSYDKAVIIAEETFQKMGKKISIIYEPNIAMVINVTPEIGRCGLIHRGAERNSTFNFVAEASQESIVTPVSCLNICAAFLEGLQLAYRIGTTNDRLRLFMTEKYSSEYRQSQFALKRLNELNIEIRGFENRLRVRFRPEKPEFSEAVTEAELFHKRTHPVK